MDCETCVLSPYCTRKTINKIDGYCRLDKYDEEERRRVIHFDLMLVGEYEKAKEYEKDGECSFLFS